MKTVLILGIDPGKTGAAAVFSSNKLIFCAPFLHRPGLEILSGMLLNSKFVRGGEVFAFLENVHSMPGEGVSSAFSFGKGVGQIEGWLAGMGYPTMLVTPQKWQSILPEGEHPKERVREWARQIWGPELAPFMLPRCRVPNQGMLDAAAIAYYGSRVLSGESEIPKKASKPRRMRQPLRI